MRKDMVIFRYIRWESEKLVQKQGMSEVILLADHMERVDKASSGNISTVRVYFTKREKLM